jgi:DMSO/TMAO reductase YedYZ molybdopterin-dependent catalytic subunit
MDEATEAPSDPLADGWELPIPADRSVFDLKTLETTIDCSSGSTRRETWTGIAIADMLEATEVNEDATHILVTGADGYRVCVSLNDALGGLLGYARPDGDAQNAPRFIGPGVGGTRQVKGVTRIDAIALTPHEDPASYEHTPIADESD